MLKPALWETLQPLTVLPLHSQLRSVCSIRLLYIYLSFDDNASKLIDILSEFTHKLFWKGYVLTIKQHFSLAHIHIFFVPVVAHDASSEPSLQSLTPSHHILSERHFLRSLHICSPGQDETVVGAKISNQEMRTTSRRRWWMKAKNSKNCRQQGGMGQLWHNLRLKSSLYWRFPNA